MLQQLQDDVEIVIAINAADIEKNKVRGDLGITYDDDVLRLIDIFRGMGFYVGSVVMTRYSGQGAADAFLKRLTTLGIQVLPPLSHRGLPLRRAAHRQRRGPMERMTISRPRHPLVVVTAPGPRQRQDGHLPLPALPRLQAGHRWRATPSSRPSPSGTCPSSIR